MKKLLTYTSPLSWEHLALGVKRVLVLPPLTGDYLWNAGRLPLKKRNCIKIFTDKTSGADSDRPGLNDCLKYLREGDVLVITKFDRLARSLRDLISIVDSLHIRGIETNTSHGKLFF